MVYSQTQGLMMEFPSTSYQDNKMLGMDLTQKPKIMERDSINDEHGGCLQDPSSVIEINIPEEGIYVWCDHNMADVVKGGAFASTGQSKLNCD